MSALLLGIATAGDVMAHPGYDGNVRNWCVDAGRLAPDVSLLTCDTCHANKDPYINLRAAPTNRALLNYFCKVPVATNNAPVVRVPASANAVEGKTLHFTVSVSDPNNNPVTLSAAGLPTGASFDPATGAFVWTPPVGAATASPTDTITFRAVDAPTNGSAPLDATANVTIHVSNSATSVNNPPDLAVIPDQSASVGQLLTFKVNANDMDGDALTLSAVGQPLDHGASFDPVVGVFSWTPTADQVTTPASPYVVTITATDNFTTPASTSRQVKIFVSATAASGTGVKRVNIKQAQWNAASGKLKVSGKAVLAKGVRGDGLVATVVDAGSGVVLGTATVARKGAWKFAGVLDQGGTPCSVQVEVNGVLASRTVARAPCQGDGEDASSGEHGESRHEAEK